MKPGDRFSSYEVLDGLGQGAMGEVFLARDTRLGRDVALKLVKPSLPADPARLARFEREARLLAQLNHPNIAALLDVEERDGATMLVLEHVPGETLAERIARGPLGVDEALALCDQVAAALAVAHEAGVVHRDVKPGNVRVRPDGVVKLLDFGLAKALRPDSSDEVAGEDTLCADATSVDAVLGTPGYMSPEQARGKAADRRADAWAFGCILYECLAGRPAFPGQTRGDRLAAVLTQEPDLARLPRGTPHGVREVLKRLLEKDPERRLRDLGDVRVLLEAARTESDAGAARGGGPGRRRRVAAGLVVLGAVASGVVIAQLVLQPAPPRPTQHLAVPFPGGLEIMALDTVGISGDGQLILYTSGGATWVRDVGLAEPRRLEQAGDLPFLSPSGRFLGNFSEGKLLKLATEGGVPVPLADVGRFPRGGSWANDDGIVYAPDFEGPLLRIAASGGAPVAVTKLDRDRSEESHRWPRVLPDGSAFLYTVKTDALATYDDAEVRVHSLRTGEDRVVVRGGTCGTVTPTGQLLFARDGKLLAQDFDLSRLEATGAPVTVIDDLATTSDTGMAFYALAGNGDLLYVSGGALRAVSRLVWTDATGRRRRGSTLARFMSARLAPDGQRAAVIVGGPGNKLWVVDLEKDSMRQLAFGGGEDHDPVWSPDGTRIVFASERGDGSALYAVAADGSGTEELLARTERQATPLTWTPDGEEVLFRTGEGSERKLWLLALEGGEPPHQIETSSPVHDVLVSPDVGALALVVGEGERRELHVQALPAGSRTRVHVGAASTWWSRDGRVLFFKDASGATFRIAIEVGPPLRLGRPEQVSDPGDAASDASAAAADVVAIEPEPEPVRELRRVTAWLDELERLVPSGGTHARWRIPAEAGSNPPRTDASPPPRSRAEAASDPPTGLVPPGTQVAVLAGTQPPTQRIAAPPHARRSEDMKSIIRGHHSLAAAAATWAALFALAPAPPVIADDCVEPPSGLVGWWPGDGSAADLVAGNDGTLVGGVTFAAGMVGQAFSLDGVHDGISILKDGSSLEMDTGNFSVGAWVSFTANFSTTAVIFFNYHGRPYHELSIESSEQAVFRFRDNDEDSVQVESTGALNDGEWHLVVGVRSGSTAELHVDGLLHDSATNTAVGSVTMGALDCDYARIGAARSDAEHCSSDQVNESFFAGLMDEVMVFNRALSGSEIQAMHDAG